MNYEFILKDIRPNKEEINSVSKTAHKILDFLNETCRKENIPAKAMFVGSFSTGYRHGDLKGKRPLSGI